MRRRSISCPVDEADEPAVRGFLVNLIRRFEHHSHAEKAEEDGA